ncbi:MAG: HlyC/CorC family transporter [Oscillospiraceae bacterium]|nr:HlyC/CorC family transporter [Oscillospiraceae bacterium]
MDVFIIVVLLLFSAIFSASETAYNSVNKARLRSIADDGNKRAIMAIKISDNFDKALTTILIGNNIVNLTASALTTIYVTEEFGIEYVAIGTAVITVVVILIGEIIPKNLANEFPEAFSLFIAYPLHWLIVVFTPVVWVLLKLKNFIVRLCGGEDKQPSLTEEELKYIIDEIEDEGVLNEEESDLVKSALEFHDISISEILIPRVNVAAVDIEDSIEEIRDVFLSTHFSRLPVYEKTIDNIVGIIHQKNFFDMYLEGRRDINEILQKPLYIFGLTAISEIMREMQKTKNHMAIVVDQYGGTQGIVTMEDIIEELVGEIYDETDEEDTSFVKLEEENEYEVSADLSIRDFLENIELEDEEIETDCNSIGGLVMENLDHIPENGEVVDCGRFTFKVVSADEQKIQRIRITVNEIDDGDDKDDDDDGKSDKD